MELGKGGTGRYVVGESDVDKAGELLLAAYAAREADPGQAGVQAAGVGQGRRAEALGQARSLTEQRRDGSFSGCCCGARRLNMGLNV